MGNARKDILKSLNNSFKEKGDASTQFILFTKWIKIIESSAKAEDYLNNFAIQFEKFKIANAKDFAKLSARKIELFSKIGFLYRLAYATDLIAVKEQMRLAAIATQENITKLDKEIASLAEESKKELHDLDKKSNESLLKLETELKNLDDAARKEVTTYKNAAKEQEKTCKNQEVQDQEKLVELQSELEKFITDLSTATDEKQFLQRRKLIETAIKNLGDLNTARFLGGLSPAELKTMGVDDDLPSLPKPPQPTPRLRYENLDQRFIQLKKDYENGNSSTKKLRAKESAREKLLAQLNKQDLDDNEAAILNGVLSERFNDVETELGKTIEIITDQSSGLILPKVWRDLRDEVQKFDVLKIFTSSQVVSSPKNPVLANQDPKIVPDEKEKAISFAEKLDSAVSKMKEKLKDSEPKIVELEQEVIVAKNEIDNKFRNLEMAQKTKKEKLKSECEALLAQLHKEEMIKEKIAQNKKIESDKQKCEQEKQKRIEDAKLQAEIAKKERDQETTTAKLENIVQQIQERTNSGSRGNSPTSSPRLSPQISSDSKSREISPASSLGKSPHITNSTSEPKVFRPPSATRMGLTASTAVAGAAGAFGAGSMIATAGWTAPAAIIAIASNPVGWAIGLGVVGLGLLIGAVVLSVKAYNRYQKNKLLSLHSPQDQKDLYVQNEVLKTEKVSSTTRHLMIKHKIKIVEKDEHGIKCSLDGIPSQPNSPRIYVNPNKVSKNGIGTLFAKFPQPNGIQEIVPINSDRDIEIIKRRAAAPAA